MEAFLTSLRTAGHRTVCSGCEIRGLWMKFVVGLLCPTQASQTEWDLAKATLIINIYEEPQRNLELSSAHRGQLFLNYHRKYWVGVY